MKKTVTMTFVSALSVFLLAGCSATSGNIETAEHSLSGGYEMAIEGHLDNRRVHDAVMQAGESAGWKMTAFKSTAIIGEKIDNDESTSVTISFGDDKVTIMQNSSASGSAERDINGLLEVVHEALQKAAAH